MLPSEASLDKLQNIFTKRILMKKQESQRKEWEGKGKKKMKDSIRFKETS